LNTRGERVKGAETAYSGGAKEKRCSFSPELSFKKDAGPQGKNKVSRPLTTTREDENRIEETEKGRDASNPQPTKEKKKLTTSRG